MTWRELTADQLNNLKDPLLVDVRAPCEHRDERIIGSVNVPLLSDAERAEVGKIYAWQGEVAARRHALKIIAPKIPEIVETISGLRKQGQPLVIHCWRGGLRSEAVASFLSVVGIDCFRLTGGYKAWRRQLLADFQKGAYRFQPIIIHGLTGVGKTDILRGLKEAGKSVLDLEALANHRGSVFGGLGLGAQPTQKNFDAALWQALREFGEEPVFLEAESRKVGRISLPDFVVDKIERGQGVLVTGTLEVRARRIVDDYALALDERGRAEAFQALLCLKERLGARRIQELQDMYAGGQIIELVKILLVEHYDPLYMRQIERARPFALEVNGDDVKSAIKTLEEWACAVRS